MKLILSKNEGEERERVSEKIRSVIIKKKQGEKALRN
jgi:hypothetical protein